MSEGDLYAGREQTLVKHTILRTYLDRFAHIVGSAWNAITYVDCFSGPWSVQSTDLRDASFYIAIQELRKARSHLHQGLGKDFAVRCFFLERDADAYRQLERFAESVTDVEIATRNTSLEQSIDDIIAFVAQRQNDAFPFVFVDPTGWTGFGLDVIAPLLRFRPGEVLVNFMTGHIVRFAEDASQRRNFDRLFGPVDYRTRIAGLSGHDREDELVRCYCDAIQAAGGYDYVCSAIVLHPEKDRTHFHLLYATRNPKGVEVFKQVEKTAMAVMEKARGAAQQREREKRSGQLELLGADDMHDTRYYDQLRDRYLGVSRTRVGEMLATHRVVPYDDAWKAALSCPLVWEADLKSWIAEWKKSGQLRVEGLKDRELVPKRNANHRLVWH